MAGAWTMTEDGEFVLNEPYKSALAKVKADATNAWMTSVVGYLVEHTDYDGQTLLDAFAAKARDARNPMEVADEFIIQALEGQL